MGQVWKLAVDLWETGNWWARAVIIFVFVPPLVALLFALGGLNPVATAVAWTPLFALVFVPLALLDPLVIVVAAGALGLHPTAAAIRQWLARWIPLYIGSVLAFGVYLYFVPISNNRLLVLPLVGAVGAMAFFAISGFRGIVVRWTTRVLAVIAIAITVAFFFSGGKKTAEVAAQTVEAEKPASAPSPGNIREVALVLLQGEGVLSEKAITIPGTVPPLWYYYFDGPPSTKVHFNGGESFPITELRGQRGGTLRFSGPKGGEVAVKAYPPP